MGFPSKTLRLGVKIPHKSGFFKFVNIDKFTNRTNDILSDQKTQLKILINKGIGIVAHGLTNRLGHFMLHEMSSWPYYGFK